MTQHTPLVPEDWIAQGYKKFTSNFKPHVAFGLQKRFDDDEGKRYFITVWVYDHEDDYHKQFMNLGHWRDKFSRYSYQPDVQFTTQNGDTFDVQFHFRNSGEWGVTSIEQLEAFFHKMWKDMWCDYYEKWEV